MTAAEPSLERDYSLSVALREGTKEAHKRAERAAYVRGFLRGIVSVSSYCGLLERLLGVYRELEGAIQRLEHHPAVGPLCRPEVFRCTAILKDLEHFRSAKNCTTLSSATQRYVRHLRELEVKAPELLVAHAYTRYLGDLSGGRILGKMLRKSLRLRDGEGDAFYHYPTINDVDAYKTDYKTMIDRLPLGRFEVEDVVEEARHSFALNRALFDELEGSEFRALVQTLAPTLSRWIYRYS